MRFLLLLTALVFGGLIGLHPTAAQSATPAPTPTDTPTAAATATVGPDNLYVYATLQSNGQPTAVVYTITAGEELLAVLLFAILIVLLFITYLVISRVA